MSERYGMKVLIFGYVLHGGGFETSMYFLSRGDSVTVTDTRSRDSLGESLDFLEGKGAVIHCGKLLEDDFREADLVIKHPTLHAVQNPSSSSSSASQDSVTRP